MLDENFPADEHCGDQATHEIGDEIKACVHIAADVGVGDGEHGDELDHFIQRAKAHAASGTEHEFSDAGITRVLGADVMAQSLPAEPGCDAKAIGMNHLIIF